MQAIACHRANLVAMGCTSQLVVSHQRQAECQVYGGRVFKIVGVKFVKAVVKFVKSVGVKLWVSSLCIDVKTRRCGSRNEEFEDLVAGRFRRGFHRGPRRCGTERTISSTSGLLQLNDPLLPCSVDRETAFIGRTKLLLYLASQTTSDIFQPCCEKVL